MSHFEVNPVFVCWAYCRSFGRTLLSKFRIKFGHEEGIQHCFYTKYQQHTPITIGVTNQKQAKTRYFNFSFQIKEKAFLIFKTKSKILL
jgi:hypothetical protein